MAAWVEKEEEELGKKTKLVVKNRVLETFFLIIVLVFLSEGKVTKGLKMLIIKDDQCGFL